VEFSQGFTEYHNKPQIISELKAAITVKLMEIARVECLRVIEDFAGNAQVCL